MQFEIYRLIDMQRLEIPLTREVKVFHVILELAVHGDFECIDNQLVGKTNAHFGSLKLSKCALSFFSVLIFSSLQNCLHPAFSYVHLSAEEAGKVNRISTNFWVHFPAIFVVCFRKVNQIPAKHWHFPPATFQYNGHTLFLTLFLIRPLGESEPFCHESVALSPNHILVQRTYIVLNAISHPHF